LIITGFFYTIAFSYIYLRALDMIRAVAAGATLLNPAGLSGYLVPFFMLPAGPVNVYPDHIKIDQEELPAPAWKSFIACADTVTLGLFLKFVVAEIWKLYFIGLQPSWPTETFQDAVIIFIYVYFDFFGYSLVALGIGRLLGIPTPINFKAPFLSTSITEFWTRWHISLGDFIRRNLFIPIQVAMVRRFGRSWAYATNVVALIACFGFVGLWHRFTLTFVAWGVVIGVVVALEKVVRDRWISTKASKAPTMRILIRALGPIYVFITIVGTLRFAMPELMGQAR
jgi:alginate O-acetyltransferase complex protein AlgI